jgi:hypothetical protein
MLVKAEHAAATERIRLLDKLVAADEKAVTKAVAKKEKKEAASAAAEAGEPVAKKPRGVWVAWVYGEPSPSDGGEPIPSVAARFPDEHTAFLCQQLSKRGADINFASEASTAEAGNPVGIPKPVAEEGESDEAYAARVEEWRSDGLAEDITPWSVDAHEVYAEHVARYKAIVEARSADGSSSKSKRVKLTEEQKLANRAARSAATKAKNEALKVAKAAEKAAAKAAKPAPKAKAAPAVVKNAAKPPPARGGAGGAKAVVVNLTAADSDSDSSSDEEEEERAPPPPPPAAKAAAKAGAKVAAPPPKAPAGAKKPGPPAPASKAKAAPPTAALSLKEEEEEAPAVAVAAAAEEVVAAEESGDV